MLEINMSIRESVSMFSVTGPRKQYVDVLAAGNTSKPCVAAPTHLFNTLPKSASMPANMFVPSGKHSFLPDVDNMDM